MRNSFSGWASSFSWGHHRYPTNHYALTVLRTKVGPKNLKPTSPFHRHAETFWVCFAQIVIVEASKKTAELHKNKTGKTRVRARMCACARKVPGAFWSMQNDDGTGLKTDFFEEEKSTEHTCTHPEWFVRRRLLARSQTHCRRGSTRCHRVTGKYWPSAFMLNATHFCPAEGQGRDQTSVFSSSYKKSF